MSVPPGPFNATGTPVSPDFVFEILLSISAFSKNFFFELNKEWTAYVPPVSQKYPSQVIMEEGTVLLKNLLLPCCFVNNRILQCHVR